MQAQQVYAPWMYTWVAPVQQPAQQNDAQPPAELFGGAEYDHILRQPQPAQQDEADLDAEELTATAQQDVADRDAEELATTAQQDDEATAHQDDEATTKHLLGERLFPLIQEREPKLAGKITRMLLEMDTTEISNLIVDPQALGLKIDETLAILRAHAD